MISITWIFLVNAIKKQGIECFTKAAWFDTLRLSDILAVRLEIVFYIILIES